VGKDKEDYIKVGRWEEDKLIEGLW